MSNRPSCIPDSEPALTNATIVYTEWQTLYDHVWSSVEPALCKRFTRFQIPHSCHLKMTARSELELLAEAVSQAAKEIEAYRMLNKLTPLSFDASRDGPAVPYDAPEAVHKARQTIIDNANRLQQLTLDSADVIPALAINVRISRTYKTTVNLAYSPCYSTSS